MSGIELQAKEGAAAAGMPSYPQGAGLYVHVPFCASMCRYCAFYKTAPQKSAVQKWLGGIAAQWNKKPGFISGSDFETCFFGGGTPGVLTPEAFRQLAGLFSENGCRFREWTVELSPSTARPRLLETLAAIGVNRISIGAQSFSDDLLRALGRRCTAARIRSAVAHIKKAGFQNFNIDLMIALPGQSPEDLLADIEEAAALEPTHISTYCLTLEDDAPLLAALEARGWRRDPGRERECYLEAWRSLPEFGYGHYEVSNFAKEGRECIHNLNTWRMGQWLGLGPSAASQWGGRRWTNAPDLDAWSEGLKTGSPALADDSILTPESLLADCLIFGLRMNAGVDLDVLAARFGKKALAPYAPLWRRLEGEGLLECDAARIFLSRNGRMLADAVGLEILETADAPA